MAGNSRKLNVEVALSGEAQYKQAISELNAANKTMGAELKRLSAEYQGNTESMEFLSKKGEALQTMLQNQREKVEQLRESVRTASQLYGEASTKTQSYAAQLATAEKSVIDLEHAIEENNDAIQDLGMTDIGDAIDDISRKLGIELPDAAKQALEGIGDMSTGTVAALGAAAAGVAALYEGIKKLNELTIEYAAKADEILTKSDMSGLSTEFLQAYQYAEQLVDVPLDTFISSMQKLTDKMADARDGNEKLAETFEALGVQITNTADGSLLPAEDVMMQTIEALHKMENETERNAVASDLFGKSYQSLNPLIVNGTSALNEYMSAAKNNYILTEDQIHALGELDDAVQKNENQWESLKTQIAAQFAPASKEALQNFTELVGAAGNALLDSGIIEGTGEIFMFLSQMMSPLTDLLGLADGATERLRPVYEVLHGIAGMLAWIEDAADAVIGALTYFTASGREKWNTALGYNAQYGQYSHLQQWNGTADVWDAYLNGYQEYGGMDMTGYGYDSATGLYYDKNTGNYVYGHNASGNDSWRGGLTWVGENGPELVNLPRGTQIESAQESRESGGDTYYITIDAKNVKEFNDIVEMAQRARVRNRMR